MPTQQEFKDISNTRLKEAKLLFDNGFYDGARYILGYALEAAFKARICKILDSNYPEGRIKQSFHTHDYDDLLILSGLEKSLDRQKTDNTSFGYYWSKQAKHQIGINGQKSLGTNP